MPAFLPPVSHPILPFFWLRLLHGLFVFAFRLQMHPRVSLPESHDPSNPSPVPSLAVPAWAVLWQGWERLFPASALAPWLLPVLSVNLPVKRGSFHLGQDFVEH